MNAEQLLRSKGLWGMDDEINELYCTILEDIHGYANGETIQDSVNKFFTILDSLQEEEEEEEEEFESLSFHGSICWTRYEMDVARDLVMELVRDEDENE